LLRFRVLSQKTAQRSARKGRNPKTGREIKIAAERKWLDLKPVKSFFADKVAE
jgi:nucleoid DNA-binding protein